MHPLSIGPHRGADWLGRSAIGGREPNVHSERYVVRVQEPRDGPDHGRTLWICLRLSSAGHAVCEAALLGPPGQPSYTASEMWPLERTLLDPERGGIGIGECSILSQSSQGLVRAGEHAIDWRLRFAGGCGQHSLLPSDALYRPRWLSHKAALLAAGAHVQSGVLRLWRALGRDAPVDTIDLRGWHVSVHHAWGRSAPVDYVLVDAPALRELGGALSFCSYETRLAHWLVLRPQTGVLCGPSALSWAGPKALRGEPQAPLPLQGGMWPFVLRGRRAELRGRIEMPAPGWVRLTAGGPGTTWVHAQARLSGTLAVAGAAPVEVHAERTIVETVRIEPESNA